MLKIVKYIIYILKSVLWNESCLKQPLKFKLFFHGTTTAILVLNRRKTFDFPSAFTTALLIAMANFEGCVWGLKMFSKFWHFFFFRYILYIYVLLLLSFYLAGEGWGWLTIFFSVYTSLHVLLHLHFHAHMYITCGSSPLCSLYIRARACLIWSYIKFS
jgi:hypothetical protein